MSQILLFWKDIQNKMHVSKILRTYYILFKFWLGIHSNRSLCINSRLIQLFPIVNLRFVGYYAEQQSLISGCQNVMKISKSDWECFHGLRKKVSLVLLCTQHSIMYSCVHSEMQLCRNISLRKSWILPILDLNSHEKVMNFDLLITVVTLFHWYSTCTEPGIPL